MRDLIERGITTISETLMIDRETVEWTARQLEAGQLLEPIAFPALKLARLLTATMAAGRIADAVLAVNAYETAAPLVHLFQTTEAATMPDGKTAHRQLILADEWTPPTQAAEILRGHFVEAVAYCIAICSIPQTPLCGTASSLTVNRNLSVPMASIYRDPMPDDPCEITWAYGPRDGKPHDPRANSLRVEATASGEVVRQLGRLLTAQPASMSHDTMESA